jgi:flavin reductase (DIM6/NTAB) family NADH-FMN oxidoreductase RutF
MPKKENRTQKSAGSAKPAAKAAPKKAAPAAKKAVTAEDRAPKKKAVSAEDKAPKKIALAKAGTMLAPVPAVVVSCGKTGVDANMLTIAWVGTVNSDPPMLSVSVRRERFSHDLIVREKAFVVNLPSRDQVRAVDWVGVKSGRDVDKWAAMKLTQDPADLVASPLIREFPINLECRVVRTVELPSHDMFIAEIVRVHVREDLVDAKGAYHPEWAGLVAYTHGTYFPVARTRLLKQGESVMKPKTAKRILNERKAKRRNARRK